MNWSRQLYSSKEKCSGLKFAYYSQDYWSTLLNKRLFSSCCFGRNHTEHVTNDLRRAFVLGKGVGGLIVDSQREAPHWGSNSHPLIYTNDYRNGITTINILKTAISPLLYLKNKPKPVDQRGILVCRILQAFVHLRYLYRAEPPGIAHCKGQPIPPQPR